jgi:hypothetical protein
MILGVYITGSLRTIHYPGNMVKRVRPIDFNRSRTAANTYLALYVAEEVDIIHYVGQDTRSDHVQQLHAA